MNIESQLIMVGVIGVLLLISYIAVRLERPGGRPCDACNAVGWHQASDGTFSTICEWCLGTGRVYHDGYKG